MYRENKGFEYEKTAGKYLKENNYEIIEENFACKFGEIDIIALKDGVTCFIEIKGRKNLDQGYPREAVTKNKQKRLVAAARYYLLVQGQDDIPCRFDVIEIIGESDEINHLENAFWT
jgi:putative endonuclease